MFSPREIIRWHEKCTLKCLKGFGYHYDKIFNISRDRVIFGRLRRNFAVYPCANTKFS